MKYTMYFAGLIACFFSIVAAQAQESKFLNSPARKLQLAEFAIANLYVDEVNEGKLVEEAIVKMLEQLDPHSTYSDPEEVKRMNEPLQGNFEGIGIQFNMAEDTLLVIQPVSGGPSEKVGILAGDRIVMVEDIYRKLLSCKVKRSARMRTATYNVDAAGARMCQGTFFRKNKMTAGK